MRAVFVVVALLVASTAGAEEWFPRFDFHFGAQYVTSSDPRFNWMFDFGGDLDVLTVGRARGIFAANYEAIAGEQFRRFDVNQGNYLLEGAILFRVSGIEVGPVWHHVSRHVSDRPKRFPVDWNMLGVQARGSSRVAPIDLSWRADARVAMATAFVDYEWELEAGGQAEYRLSPRTSIIAGSSWRVVDMDGTRMRGTQLEGRAEVGVRLAGRGAAAELFVGAERRLDPYPTEFGTASWFLAGMRLRSR